MGSRSLRYALADKELTFESMPLGFTDIPKVFAGRCKTVPVLAENDQTIVDSWAIVDHLERTHPDRPALFSGPEEYAMVRLFDACFTVDMIRKLSSPSTPSTFTMQPAARIASTSASAANSVFLRGTPLEAHVDGRETRLPVVRETLTPLRLQLSRNPFLGGPKPNYADYIAFGGFQWVASVNTLRYLFVTPARGSLHPIPGCSQSKR